MKNFKTFLILLAFLGLSFNSARAQNIPVDGITFESTHWEEDGSGGGYISIAVGETAQLWIYISPQNATIQGVTVESSNPEVFAVLPDFAILGLKAGEEFITVRSLDPSYTEELTINVKVRKIPVEGISFQYSHSAGGDGYNMRISEGDIGTIYFSVTPYDATIQEITVESNNPEIVNVSILFGGKRISVFTYNEGNAVLSIRSKDPSYTEEHIFHIEVIALAQGDMVVDPSSLTLEVGEFGYVTATHSGNPVVISEVTWSVSDDMVAKIDEWGSIRTITPGTAVITAVAANGVTAVCDLTVVRTPPEQPFKPTIVLVSGDVVSGKGLNQTLTTGAKVRLICSSDDARIKFTTDGSDPKESTTTWAASGTANINVDREMTIRAIAFRDDGFNISYSSEFKRNYSLPQLEKPVLNPVRALVNFATYGSQVELKYPGLLSGVEIRYTINGYEPDETSPLYTGPITLNESIETYYETPDTPRKQIKAKTFKSGHSPSVTATFLLKVFPNTPVYDPVTSIVTCGTPGVQLRYTTDNSSPNETSALYNGAQLNNPATGFVNYKFRAFKSGFSPSLVTDVYLGAQVRTPILVDRDISSNAQYNLMNAKSTESPATLTVTQGHRVRFFCQTINSVVRYTTDGSEPTESSTQYVYGNPVIMGNTNTVFKAKGFRAGHPESETAIFTFKIAPPPPPPTFSQEGPLLNYNAGIRLLQPEATGFIYTKNGSIPEIDFKTGNCTNGTYLQKGSFIRIQQETLLKVRSVKKVDDTNSNNKWIQGDVVTKSYNVRPFESEFDAGSMNRTMPSNTPLLKNKLMNIALNSINFNMRVLDGKIKIVIGDNFPKSGQSYDDAFNLLKSCWMTNSYPIVKMLLDPISKETTFASGNAGFEVAGFLEGNLNLDENPSNLTGKLVFYANSNVNWEMYVIILTARIDFKGNLWFWGGATLNFNSSPKISEPQAELYYNIKLEGRAGIGVPVVGGVGVFGSLKFNHDWNMVHNWNKMWLEGKMGVYEKFLLWTWKQHIVKGTWSIWNTFPGSKGDFDQNEDEWFMPRMYDFSNYKLMPRAVSSEWLGSMMPRVRNATMSDFLQQSIYTETAPLIAKADGRRVMVFLADDPERDDYNRTVLMYSVYNSSTDTWSNPNPVNDNGTADFFPSIASDGSIVWVTWQRSNTTFSPNVEIEDVLAAGEIAVSIFNTATETFETPFVLTNNDIIDTHPKIASDRFNVLATWIQNPDNAIFGKRSASNRIMVNERTLGEWGANVILKDNLANILDLDVAFLNNKYLIAYITDEDNDMETFEDRSLHIITYQNSEVLDEQTIVTNKIVSGIRFTSLDGNKVLTWFEEGRIRYMTVDGQINNLTAEQDMPIDNFKVFSNYNKTAVVYPYSENEIGYLYAREYEDGQLSAPYKLAKTGGQANYFDGFFDDDNNFNIAYNNSVMLFDEDDDEIIEENDLLFIKTNPNVNIRLTDILYFQKDVKLGQPINIKLDVENIGGIPLNGVDINVNGVLVSSNSTKFKIGEKKTLDLSFIVPSTMAAASKFEITVAPSGKSDVNMDDNSLSISLGHTNFDLSFITDYTVIDTLTVTTTVTNNSDFDANAILLARLGTPDGLVIGMTELGNIAGRESVAIDMVFDIEDIVPEKDFFVRLYFEVVSDAEEEYSISDFIVVNSGKDRMILSGIAYEIVDNERQPLEDVTVTCWRADDENGTNARIWEGNMEDEEFINPQITEEIGCYSWFAAEGWWQVRLTKEGYHDAQSEWVYIPTSQYEVDVQMNSLTNINPNKMDNNTIVVYPNPTKGELRVKNGELKIENIEIFDVIGRVQSSKFKVQSSQPETLNPQPETIIDISHLPSGFYFLGIRTDKGIFTAKVVKN